MQRTYRAIDIAAPGGPEVLVPVDLPLPRPAGRELLIEVHAAGVNRADLKQREGTYPMPPDAPSVPGLEACGIVVACGPDVTRFAVGDRVCALLLGGGYAEYCVCPEVQCLPLPAGLSFVEGAALPEAVFTVWMAVFEQARLVPGETLLVQGGASGIGTMAIQMARATGARVIATAGTPARVDHCRQLGAELVVDYHRQDFRREIEARLGMDAVDVILDVVGAPYFDAHVALLRIGGRLCYIAGDGGRQFGIDLRPLMQKRIYVTGATLRHRPVDEKGRLAREIERRMWPLVAQGTIRPQVGATFALGEAAAAHRALAAGTVTGKAVLVCR